MSDQHRNPAKPHNAPPTDAEGKPVNVVERSLEEDRGPERDFDKVVTPTSTKVLEQDVEALERKNAQVERKLRE
ncbi:hypothetical protein [Pseudomonas fulva]|nr:hypothetical protein [Pseudomonas fulva]MBF8778201.1 hypothetical protein [Pseudomonas fulva]